MSQALHPMLNIAVKAAREAGRIINRASLDLDPLMVGSKGRTTSSPRSTAPPRRRSSRPCSAPIRATPSSPRSRAASTARKDSEYCWIIDPLDGTTNFIHGFPVYAVSIALAFRGQVQQAVVYDPTRNDLYYASKGRGAYLNDKRLRVSRRTRMADSLIGTGFPFRARRQLRRAT